jgi:hypothetical protein
MRPDFSLESVEYRFQITPLFLSYRTNPKPLSPVSVFGSIFQCAGALPEPETRRAPGCGSCDNA